MAVRPIYLWEDAANVLVREVPVEFTWFPGYAHVQKQKSIQSLHESANAKGLGPVLEISTKSDDPLGIRLSAFNLKFEHPSGKIFSVEAAYQASKVFETGGPFLDLLGLEGRQIKGDSRLRESGPLIGFEFSDEKWPLRPVTAFYDWIYITALLQNRKLSLGLLDFRAYSDIEFNPNRSLSTQARSAALFVSLAKRGILDSAMIDKHSFLSVIETHGQEPGVNKSDSDQPDLFFE
jgi:hypothetical protein